MATQQDLSTAAGAHLSSTKMGQHVDVAPHPAVKAHSPGHLYDRSSLDAVSHQGFGGDKEGRMTQLDSPLSAAPTGNISRQRWQRAIHRVRLEVRFSRGLTTLRTMRGGENAIQPSALKRLRLLGQGAFATVEQAIYSPPGGGRPYKVAVKRLKPSMTKNLVDLECFKAEINLLRRLQNNHIVEFVGVTPDLALVQEFMDGGTLKQLVYEQMLAGGRRLWQQADALRWAIQVASGLVYLHCAKPMVIHRDLKLENLLLKTKETATSCIKIADFGLVALVSRTAPGAAMPGASDVSTRPVLDVDTMDRMDRQFSSMLLAERATPGRSRPMRATGHHTSSAQHSEPTHNSRNTGNLPDVNTASLATAVVMNGRTNASPPGMLQSMGQIPEDGSGLRHNQDPNLYSESRSAGQQPSTTTVADGAQQRSRDGRRERISSGGSLLGNLSPFLAMSSQPHPSSLASQMTLADSNGMGGGNGTGGGGGVSRLRTMLSSGLGSRRSLGGGGALANRLIARRLKAMGEDGTDASWGLSGQTGSCMYMAPEVFLNKPYNEKADVFSFGIIMMELFSRYITLYAISNKGTVEEIHAYAGRIAGGYRPPLPTDWPASLTRLIQDCWQQDPAARPCMAQVLERLLALKSGADIVELDRQESAREAACCMCTIS